MRSLAEPAGLTILVTKPTNNLGKLRARIGQAVEVVLALAARGNNATVSQQCKVVAHCGLALAKLVAECANMLLAVVQNQDDLKSGWITHVLQQGRSLSSMAQTQIRFFNGFRLGYLGDHFGGFSGFGNFRNLLNF